MVRDTTNRKEWPERDTILFAKHDQIHILNEARDHAEISILDHEIKEIMIHVYK